jgi:hypothetical protein
MPLNWRALYPQIPRVAEAEIARLWRNAEQASAVAEELIGGRAAQADAEPIAPLSANDLQTALTWLGAAIRAWDVVVAYYPENSPEHQAGSQRRQRLQQALLALLRQSGSQSGQ